MINLKTNMIPIRPLGIIATKDCPKYQGEGKIKTGPKVKVECFDCKGTGRVNQ